MKDGAWAQTQVSSTKQFLLLCSEITLRTNNLLWRNFMHHRNYYIGKNVGYHLSTLAKEKKKRRRRAIQKSEYGHEMKLLPNQSDVQ